MIEILLLIITCISFSVGISLYIQEKTFEQIWNHLDRHERSIKYFRNCKKQTYPNMNADYVEI
jgi:hypothetical protein